MKSFAVAILAAWIGHAQQFPRSLEELQSELERDLRGTTERTQAPPGDIPGPARPTGASISVQSLRHQVPKAARQSFARARKLWQHGDHNGAAGQLEQAVQRDPEFAEAYNALGAQYAVLGRFDEGKAAFEHAIAVDPNHANAHYNLAVLLLEIGDNAGAEQSVRRHLQSASEDPKAHWLLGYLLYLRDSTRAEGLRHMQYAARTVKAAKQFLASLPGAR